MSYELLKQEIISAKHVTPIGVVGRLHYVCYLTATGISCAILALLLGGLLKALGLSSFGATSSEDGFSFLFLVLIAAPWFEGLVAWLIVSLQLRFLPWPSNGSFFNQVSIMSLIPASLFTLLHASRGLIAISVVPLGFAISWIQIFRLKKGAGFIGWVESSVVHMIYNGVVVGLFQLAKYFGA